MSRVKNISGGPRFVPLLDREVAGGETVDVPDVQADGESPVVWPERVWQPVTENPAKADTSGKADA
jgi:hypothetical protein